MKFIILATIIYIGSALSVSIHFILEKWGIIELYQLHKGRFKLTKWLPICSFCFMFWVNMIFVIILSVYNFEWIYLLAPFAAAPIATNYLK